ncbi:hypothetical protein JL722_3955 [Aureococcus anophagefferens]|nr:hypothetical protein JL722_3955 [Aureococcus anophagefferens]
MTFSYAKWDAVDASDGEEEEPIEPYAGPSSAALKAAAAVVARKARAREFPEEQPRSAFAKVARGDDMRGLADVFLGDPATFEPERSSGVARHWGLGVAPSDDRRRRALTIEFLYRGLDTPEKQFLRVSLAPYGDTSGPIWRTLRVSGSLTLWQLHDAAGAAMGWSRGAFYFTDLDDGATWCPVGDLDASDAATARDLFVDALDPRRTRVGDVLREPGASLGYTYDLESRWEHGVSLCRVFDVDESRHGIAVLDGALRCPDEDGGGNAAYAAAVLDPWRAAGGSLRRAATLDPPRFAVGRAVLVEAPGEPEKGARWEGGVVARTNVDRESTVHAYAVRLDAPPHPNVLVPVDDDDHGATPFLRVAKPLASFGLCFGAGKALGAPAGLAYVALQTAAGFALHRRWCAARGKPRWLGTTSPYLFRNPGQAKLWAAVCP